MYRLWKPQSGIRAQNDREDKSTSSSRVDCDNIIRIMLCSIKRDMFQFFILNVLLFMQGGVSGVVADEGFTKFVEIV